MTHYVAVIFKWTRGETGLQTGIPDSVRNFDIQTGTMKKTGGTWTCNSESDSMYNALSELLGSISQS